MINRDDYIQKLKSQIDDWNAEAAHWEDKAKKAQSGVKAEAERRVAGPVTAEAPPRNPEHDSLNGEHRNNVR